MANLDRSGIATVMRVLAKAESTDSHDAAIALALPGHEDLRSRRRRCAERCPATRASSALGQEDGRARLPCCGRPGSGYFRNRRSPIPISARPAPHLKLWLTFLRERTPPTPTTALKGSGTTTADELGPVIERELALMSPSVRRSAALVAELLDPEFREIGMSGRSWTRPEAIQALACEPTDESCAAEVTDIEGTVLEPNLVLLTYVSSRGGRRARRSSLWRCSDGNWRLVLHQGTPI